jgi:hypothetical protein
MTIVDKFLRNVPTHDSDVSHEFIHLTDTPTTYSGSENKYVKTTASGLVFSDITIENVDHGELLGLLDDDHPQYVPTDGARGFTSTVSGVFPIESYDLTPRDYVIGVMDGSIGLPGLQGSLIQFSYNEDASESSTNSTVFQQKLRLTVSGIPEGNYRVGWTYQWRHSKSNSDFLAKIDVDDTDTIFSYQASPYVDVLYWQPVTGFYYYEVLASGTHTIDLDYKSSNTGSTSYIKETKLEFWRIQ